MLTALLKSLTACLHPSLGLVVQNFLFNLSPIVITFISSVGKFEAAFLHSHLLPIPLKLTQEGSIKATQKSNMITLLASSYLLFTRAGRHLYTHSFLLRLAYLVHLEKKRQPAHEGDGEACELRTIPPLPL